MRDRDGAKCLTNIGQMTDILIYFHEIAYLPLGAVRKMENEKEMRRQNLLKGLAVSWAMRAIGKGSHAGFNACMEEVRSIVPDEVWNRISTANLHFLDPLKRWVEEMKTEIPADVWVMVGGDTPSIARLQGLVEVA